MAALPCPPLPGRADAEAAPQTRPRPCAHLCCAGSRGHRGGIPASTAEEPAGKSAPYLEEGTDLILLQVGLDPGLLVRRHEELRRRGLELLSPGGGCSPSGCSRLTPPPPKGCHSGSGGRRCEGAAARSPRDGANSGNRGAGGGSRVPVARLTGRGPAAGCLPSGSSGRALPGAEHGAGRRRAAKAAPVPAPRSVSVCLSVCVYVCVRARACAWQRLGYGNSRDSSCRPRHSAAPEANGRGLPSAPRPLAPELRRTKGGSEGRGGERAGGGGCSAPFPLLSPPPLLTCLPGDGLLPQRS